MTYWNDTILHILGENNIELISSVSFYFLVCLLEKTLQKITQKKKKITPKSLQIVTAAMKLKDTYSLKESYDQT